MYKLAMEWFRYAKNQEEKESTKTVVLNAEPAFDLLKKVLISRKNSIPAVTEKEYEKADWTSLQAHRNGRIQEIDHLLQLLTFKERQ